MAGFSIVGPARPQHFDQSIISDRDDAGSVYAYHRSSRQRLESTKRCSTKRCSSSTTLKQIITLFELGERLMERDSDESTTLKLLRANDCSKDITLISVMLSIYYRLIRRPLRMKSQTKVATYKFGAQDWSSIRVSSELPGFRRIVGCLIQHSPDEGILTHTDNTIRILFVRKFCSTL